MAEYGLVVRNASGNLVIDGTYANLAFVRKVTVSMSGTPMLGSNGGMYYKSFSVTDCQTPILAMTPADFSCLYFVSQSGSTFTYQLHSVSQASVDIYVFDVPEKATKFPGNYALIVKNKNTGAVVFDSRCPYMLVKDFIAGNTEGPYGNAENGAFPAFNKDYGVSKIAVVQASNLRDTVQEITGVGESNPNAIYVATVSAAKVAGGTLSLNIQASATFFGRLSQMPANSYDNGTYMYLAVDVSNISA